MAGNENTFLSYEVVNSKFSNNLNFIFARMIEDSEVYPDIYYNPISYKAYIVL